MAVLYAPALKECQPAGSAVNGSRRPGLPDAGGRLIINGMAANYCNPVTPANIW
jgi:hypothetical protein